MKLLTEEIKKRLLKNDNPESLLEEQKVMCKFFHPLSSWTWYVISMEADEDTLYGIVRGHETELGYTSLVELSTLKIKGLGVERDLNFQPQNAQEVLDQLKSGEHV